MSKTIAEKLQIGLRPISQIALSDAWSALRFRVLAPGEEFDPG